MSYGMYSMNMAKSKRFAHCAKMLAELARTEVLTADHRHRWRAESERLVTLSQDHLAIALTHKTGEYDD